MRTCPKTSKAFLHPARAISRACRQHQMRHVREQKYSRAETEWFRHSAIMAGDVMNATRELLTYAAGDILKKKTSLSLWLAWLPVCAMPPSFST